MTYRHRVATVFLFGFFLDLINMFIASIAFPAISARWRFPSRSWRGSVMPIFSV
ncbi:major facilitator family transporter [Klebsiella pneumoniae]|uniref:Major facilitator family transporter n=1 Tax=Klebsiella pneumoniae TaxID=573 RepID=A0A377VCU3_KLEPN|nr:major facilitator family transporter [Klebsiella pneumoniae]